MSDKRLVRQNPPPAVDNVARRIYLVRGQRVMFDSDLADIYGVTTGNLNLAVRRNTARFPEDFMFQLTAREHDSLLLQFARANAGRGGRRTSPYAFTELGVAMLSSVLNSERAVQMNIVIMRAFVKLREALMAHKALARRIEEIANTQKDHAGLFDIVIADIQKLDRKLTREVRLLRAPRPRKPKIGFVVPA